MRKKAQNDKFADRFRSAADARMAELLKAERLKAGLTQHDVAAKLGKPQSFVAKYETGERHIDVLDLINIARALNFEPGRFVTKIAAFLKE